jgi:hypothetical protein
VLSRQVSVTAAARPLGAVVAQLRSADRLPLSFVEDAAGGTVSGELHGVPLRSALRTVLARLPNYQCLVGNDHVLIAARDSAYQATVRDVAIIRQPHWHAAHMYIARLIDMPAFHGLKTYVERPEDRTLLREEVSLAKEGTVLGHLVQLLGDNPRAFFTISRLPAGRRELSLGSVP